MKTKAIIFGVSMFMIINTVVFAQIDTIKTNREYVAYTMFYNVVPDQFNYPLIGFVNVAKGNHKGVQLGFVNTTLKDQRGLKAGFVNTVKGSATGFHLGFVNTAVDNYSGFQMGFINTTLNENKCLQTGFVNTARGNASGAQIGFINLSGKKLTGSQIGFINIADSISNGIPIGFLSIVKKGGYRAIEVSTSELYPVNMTFKIGVPKFYSFFQGSYNSNYSKPFAMGLGFGSLISMGSKFYFNPEIGNTSTFEGNSNTTALVTNFRYSIGSKFQIAAGPSVVWYNYTQEMNTYDSPFFAVLNKEVNGRNRFLLGARIALSYHFTDL